MTIQYLKTFYLIPPNVRVSCLILPHSFYYVFIGRIHTGSGSVPDSSEPYASGRLRVGFAFTLQKTDPTRTVRVHFAVYTLRLLLDRL